MYCVMKIHPNHRFEAQVKVLNDIYLKELTGSIYVFLEPSGTGKTTTLII
jgi:ABC-type Fe3+/spermidine/putrescine transport system ATPase subunit